MPDDLPAASATANNMPALQFDCDSHPSRTWRINDVGGNGINQISNVQTGKCVTIAGGTLADNNIPGVQFIATATCRAAGPSG